MSARAADELAAPLATYLARIDGYWRPPGEVDSLALAPGFSDTPITVGDLRKAVAAIQSLAAELAAERALFAEAERMQGVITPTSHYEKGVRSPLRWGRLLVPYDECAPTFREAIERSLARKGGGAP